MTTALCPLPMGLWTRSECSSCPQRSLTGGRWSLLISTTVPAPIPSVRLSTSERIRLPRIELHVDLYPSDVTPPVSNSRPVGLSDGTASWDSVSTLTGNGVSFDVARPGALIWGQGWGIYPTGDHIKELAEQLSITDAGFPALDPTSGFVLVASSPIEPLTTVASYGLDYQSIVDHTTLQVIVQRLNTADDGQLRAGAFAERRTIAGRDVWLFDNMTVTWMAEPELRVTVSSLGLDVAELFAGLHEVTRAEFAATTGLEGLEPGQ